MDVWIIPGCLPNFRQNSLPLWVVCSLSPGQDQLQVVMFLHQPISLNNPQRIFEAVKTGYLQKHGFVRRNVKPAKNLGLLLRGEIAILITQRVNRREDEELGDREALGKSGQGENGRIVIHHKLL